MLTLLVRRLERFRSQLFVDLALELGNLHTLDVSDAGGVPGPEHIAAEQGGSVAVLAACARQNERGRRRQWPKG